MKMKGVGALSDLPKANVNSFSVKEKARTPMGDDLGIQWMPPKKRWSEKLARNMSLSAALLIAIAAIRTVGHEPTAQAVFHAIEDQLTWDMDEELGKLTFVSNMLPEASMVFWNGASDIEISAPVNGKVIHTWSTQEPYLLLEGKDTSVSCCADGEVMSIAHGENEEEIIRVRHENGLESLYGNIQCFVEVGDAVLRDQVIGNPIKDTQVYFEVRQAGRSIDPALYTSKGRTSE